MLALREFGSSESSRSVPLVLLMPGEDGRVVYVTEYQLYHVTVYWGWRAIPSFRSPVVDQERMRPVHGDFSLVGVSAWTSIQCFDTVGRLTGRASSLK